jgi:hypothetical protein
MCHHTPEKVLATTIYYVHPHVRGLVAWDHGCKLLLMFATNSHIYAPTSWPLGLAWTKHMIFWKLGIEGWILPIVCVLSFDLSYALPHCTV